MSKPNKNKGQKTQQPSGGPKVARPNNQKSDLKWAYIFLFALGMQYKIRLKGSLRQGKKVMVLAPPPQWLTELVYPLFQVPGPRDRNETTGPKPGQ